MINLISHHFPAPAAKESQRRSNKGRQDPGSDNRGHAGSRKDARGNGRERNRGSKQ